MRDDSIEQRFSAAAATYDDHASIQAQVTETLISIIKDLPHTGRLLEIGCGTGLLTCSLRDALPTAMLTAIDVSPEMIRQAQSKFSDDDSVNWIVSDVRDFEPKLPYETVVSSAALHWLNSAREAARAVDRVVQPQGHIALSIMVRGSLGELHACRNEIAPNKAVDHFLPSSSEWKTAASDCGWLIQRADDIDFTICYESARTFLSALHQQGVTGGRFSRPEVQLNRRELDRLIRSYEARYRDAAGNVRATYRVCLIHAVKMAETRGNLRSGEFSRRGVLG